MLVSDFEIFKRFLYPLIPPPPTYLRFCVDILFRTFLDILLLYPPWFYTASHFLRFPFLLSLTLTFLSKILRGHTVPHFLRSCFASTLSSLSPLFSIFTIYSSHHSYLRFCVDILFRTFLDILLFLLIFINLKPLSGLYS